MTGTPVQPPEGDGAAGLRAGEDLLGWGRLVPARGDYPREVAIREVPVNATVMGTAPGESPLTR